MLFYLIGFWKTVGKSGLKNLTALLAEIGQPGPAQITLDEEDLRECEGRKKPRESERERERERERDLDPNHIPGHNFLPKPLSVCPGTIRHKGYKRTLA